MLTISINIWSRYWRERRGEVGNTDTTLSSHTSSITAGLSFTGAETTPCNAMYIRDYFLKWREETKRVERVLLRDHEIEEASFLGGSLKWVIAAVRWLIIPVTAVITVDNEVISQVAEKLRSNPIPHSNQLWRPLAKRVLRCLSNKSFFSRWLLCELSKNYNLP